MSEAWTKRQIQRLDILRSRKLDSIAFRLESVYGQENAQVCSLLNAVRCDDKLLQNLMQMNTSDGTKFLKNTVHTTDIGEKQSKKADISCNNSNTGSNNNNVNSNNDTTACTSFRGTNQEQIKRDSLSTPQDISFSSIRSVPEKVVGEEAEKINSTSKLFFVDEWERVLRVQQRISDNEAHNAKQQRRDIKTKVGCDLMAQMKERATNSTTTRAIKNEERERINQLEQERLGIERDIKVKQRNQKHEIHVDMVQALHNKKEQQKREISQRIQNERRILKGIRRKMRAEQHVEQERMNEKKKLFQIFQKQSELHEIEKIKERQKQIDEDIERMNLCAQRIAKEDYELKISAEARRQKQQQSETMGRYEWQRQEELRRRESDQIRSYQIEKDKEYKRNCDANEKKRVIDAQHNNRVLAKQIADKHSKLELSRLEQAKDLLSAESDARQAREERKQQYIEHKQQQSKYCQELNQQKLLARHSLYSESMSEEERKMNQAYLQAYTSEQYEHVHVPLPIDRPTHLNPHRRTHRIVSSDSEDESYNHRENNNERRRNPIKNNSATSSKQSNGNTIRPSSHDLAKLSSSISGGKTKNISSDIIGCCTNNDTHVADAMNSTQYELRNPFQQTAKEVLLSTKNT